MPRDTKKWDSLKMVCDQDWRPLWKSSTLQLSCQWCWILENAENPKSGLRKGCRCIISPYPWQRPGSRFPIPQIPALPNVSQERRPPCCWWPRNLPRKLRGNSKMKTVLQSPLTNALQLTTLSCPVYLSRNEIPRRDQTWDHSVLMGKGRKGSLWNMKSIKRG